MKQQYYLENCEEPTFTGYFSRAKKQVESELSQFVSSLSHLYLHSRIEYAVLTEGKRFRPLLVILSAESVGGKRSKVMPLALAFELMHTATLVHDDIIDQDAMRRGRPSLHKKWSVNDAILTGDALIALAVNVASAYGETILKNVSQTALELCEGESLDLVDSLETTEEDYFNRIRYKSASLCTSAAYCGAIAGGGSPGEARSLAMFGENFGTAYQLRDDILDFSIKRDSNFKDPENGRITLPLIYSYARSSAKEKREIEKFQDLLRSNPSEADERAREIVKLVHRKGAFEYCEKMIDMYLSHALSSIATLKETRYKAYLTEMARTLRSWAGTDAKQT
jgi:geranylgeranyl pyrophosphate synthase